MRPMKFYLDTHDHRSNTFPAGISKDQFATFFAAYEKSSREEECVVVPTRLVRRLLDAERAFREFVFGALSGRILDLMRTLEEVGSDQVQQRVARYLLRHQGPDASVRVSQARIAAEVGTAREVIFRALRSLSARSRDGGRHGRQR